MSRSAALAFAWDTVSRYGEPVGGAGQDHVCVPLTQHELARRNGCSPGTVSWYLRQLGTAVVTRRNGIVFDRAALAGLRASTPQLAPRTALVERELLESLAQPAADGTYVELLVDHPAGPKPPSLQDLATQLGMNRSSAHRHVNALERAGRLQRHGRRLYAVPPGHPTKEPIVEHEPQAPDSGDGVGVVSPQQVLRLLEKVTDLLTLVAGTANQLLGATGAATTGAHDPRSGGAQSAANAEVRAVVVADRDRAFSSEVDLIDEIDPQITSNPSCLRAEGSRDTDGLRAQGPRTEAGADWSPEDLPDLLAPLLEECDRLDRPGVADAQRVVGSLRRYSAEQIATAARQMAADLRSGAPMRSPIAILVRKAEDGDPYYFRAQRAAEPPPPPAPVIDEPEDPVDAEAVAAVERLEPDALEQLDAAVAAHVRGILGERTSALDSPTALAYWRPIVWRQRQQPNTAEGA